MYFRLYFTYEDCSDGVGIIILICIWCELCLYILVCFDSDYQQPAGNPERQYGSRNKMSERDEDDDKPPGGGHAKVKRR